MDEEERGGWLMEMGGVFILELMLLRLQADLDRRTSSNVSK
jgi:hypothetical protein